MNYSYFLYIYIYIYNIESGYQNEHVKPQVSNLGTSTRTNLVMVVLLRIQPYNRIIENTTT